MPNKHALLIGVNDYPNLDPKYKLAGCVNDAKLMRTVLVDHFEFDPANVTELHDEAASEQAILAAMDNLRDTAQRDDIVVFHFSGHGSWRTTANPEKAWGRDNTIMPNDSGRSESTPNVDITDDTIYAWLETLAAKTRYITLIFDCCHSGTITRDVTAGAARNVEGDGRSLEEMGVQPLAVPLPMASTPRSADEGSWLGKGNAYVVISGCRDNEKSREFDGFGALTQNLAKALREAEPGSTYRDVFDLASHGVTSRYDTQHPQIEGQLNREVLGVKDLTPMRFLKLEELEDGIATVNGGRVHGVKAGDRWLVYPAGTKQTAGIEPVADLEIVEVGPLTSEARVIEQMADVTPGARCVEQRSGASLEPIKVNLASLGPGEQQAFRDGLQQASFIEFTDTDADAFVHVKEITVGGVVQPNWVCTGSDDALLIQSQPIDSEQALSAVAEDLERVARYRTALNLDNPDTDLDVDFNIYQQKGDDWVIVNDGSAEFADKDRIAFEVVNRTDAAIFFSLLEFGINNEVSLLFPPNVNGERIEAGKTFTFGQRKRKVRLISPYNPQGIAELDSGTETFKAFLSTEPTNVTWWCQDDSFGLTAKAAEEDAPTTRGEIDWGDDDGPDWRAINRSFTLKR